MTKRSPVAVLLLALFVPFYAWYWLVKTKNEMVQCGANVPTAWIWLIPFAVFYWQWKFGGGVEHVTQGKSSQAISFILLFLLGGIGMAIIQSSLNQAIDRGMPSQMPAARVA